VAEPTSMAEVTNPIDKSFTVVMSFSNWRMKPASLASLPRMHLSTARVF
jgi:hypothetical protein